MFGFLANIRYHFYTLILFTYSDIKTIVIPTTVFGVLGSLSGSLLMETNAKFTAIARAPLVALWVWMNLLPFAISNQRRPSGIKEDLQNKPWRPLPRGRISPEQAKYLMIVLYAVGFLASLYLGGLRSCLALMILGYWYNDLEGADNSFIIRNLINAAGYLSFITGALDVATQSEILYRPKAYLWLLLIGVIVFSTVQMQDFADQSGDRIRGRLSLPLVVGDGKARWSVAILVPVWSVLAPIFWQLGGKSLAMPVLLGTTISVRVLRNRTEANDKLTFKIWNLWILTLYSLPIVTTLYW